MEGRAQRAHAILAYMQRCCRSLEHNSQYNHHHHGVLVGLDTTTPQLYKYDLPHPNYDTYFLVLKLFASTKPHDFASQSSDGNLNIDTVYSLFPQRARDIALQMQQAYLEEGKLELKPTVVIWNQVLATWANSSYRDKAYHAYILLRSMRVSGSDGGEVPHTIDNTVSETLHSSTTTTTTCSSSSYHPVSIKVPLVPDISSYGHVLRACALSNQDASSKKLASGIAIRVLTDLERDGDDGLYQSLITQQQVEPNAITDDYQQSHSQEATTGSSASSVHTSHLYAFALRSLSYISESSLRDKWLRRQFIKCCQQGLVNAHVLHELQNASIHSSLPPSSSLSVWDEIIQKYDQKEGTHVLSAHGISALLRNLPREWTRNGSSTNSWGW